ncbi:hypothetical protein [Pilimelia columellifera]|uniref:Pycsar effector protein domain-containing protein n=1 Tax=Pilimelia columellifera subsp. columellifera TaxID=706583 RepID=A0ABP6AYM1_9ACTN
MTADATAHRLDATWRALQQVQEAIRFADVKAGAVLTIAGVFTGLIVHTGVPGRVGSRTGLLVGSVLVVVVGSALLALATLAPRPAEEAMGAVHQSGRLARQYRCDKELFLSDWLRASSDPATLSDALAEQLWRANIIADDKFRRVALALRLLYAAVALWLAAVVFI